MKERVVKQALCLLERAKMDEIEANQKDRRIRKIEVSLEHITNQLSTILNKTTPKM